MTLSWHSHSVSLLFLPVPFHSFSFSLPRIHSPSLPPPLRFLPVDTLSHSYLTWHLCTTDEIRLVRRSNELSAWDVINMNIECEALPNVLSNRAKACACLLELSFHRYFYICSKWFHLIPSLIRGIEEVVALTVFFSYRPRIKFCCAYRL